MKKKKIIEELIFNPNKDIKQLLDYGFKYNDINGKYSLELRNHWCAGQIVISINS